MCGSGEVEDECHFVMGCYMYELPRKLMFLRIFEESNNRVYLEGLRDEKEWLIDVLLGHGYGNNDSINLVIQRAVAEYVRCALVIRNRVLGDSEVGMGLRVK